MTSSRLTIGVSAELHELVTDTAKAADMPVSEYVKKLICSDLGIAYTAPVLRRKYASVEERIAAQRERDKERRTKFSEWLKAQKSA